MHHSLPSFLRTRKNKRFNYTPRHFDPAEERRLERKKRREAMLREEGLLGTDEQLEENEKVTPARKLYPNGKRISFRTSELDKMSSSSYRTSVKSSNMRLLVIVVGLIVLTIVGYFYLEQLFTTMPAQ